MGIASFYHLLALLVTFYGILIALIYTAWEKEKRRALRDGPATDAAVILLEGPGLPPVAPTLLALAGQDYPGRVEVAVVHLGPDAEGALPDHGAGVRTVRLRVSAPPTRDERGRPLTLRQEAYQLGIAETSSEVCVLVEPGGVPGPGWLNAMCAGLTPDSHLVMGPVRTDAELAGDGHFLAGLQEADAIYRSALAAGGAATGRPAAGAGLNLAVRRSILDAIGGLAGTGRALSITASLSREVVQGLGGRAVRSRVATAACLRIPPAPDAAALLERIRRWAAGVFPAGGLSGWLAWTSLFTALLFWGGLVLMPLLRPFAPLPAIGPYLGFFFAVGIFQEGARAISGSSLPRALYVPHMLFHLAYLALIGPLMLAGGSDRYRRAAGD